MESTRPTVCVVIAPFARSAMAGTTPLKTVRLELKAYNAEGRRISRVRLQIPSSVTARASRLSSESEPPIPSSSLRRSDQILKTYPGINSVVRAICSKFLASDCRLNGCGLVPSSAIPRSPRPARPEHLRGLDSVSGQSGQPNRLPFGLRSC